MFSRVKINLHLSVHTKPANWLPFLTKTQDVRRLLCIVETPSRIQRGWTTRRCREARSPLPPRALLLRKVLSFPFPLGKVIREQQVRRNPSEASCNSSGRLGGRVWSWMGTAKEARPGRQPSLGAGFETSLRMAGLLQRPNQDAT